MYKNIALTGGGTGGHIYPCLSIAENLNENFPEIKLFYFGNPEKLEAKLLKSTDLKDSRTKVFMDYIKFVAIESEPFNAKKFLAWSVNFWQNTQKAKNKLKENNIDLVFGTGGYVSGPIFAACKSLKIPYIIHNLDASIGLANRLFIKDARALTLGICDLGIKPRSGLCKVTGNPISKSFEQIQKQKKNKSQLLITGGSQGALDINNAIGKILPELSKLDLEIYHITGNKLYENYVRNFLDNNPVKFSNYTIKAYTHEMPYLCAFADLAVCRAGAMTIAEMIAARIVPIFVPLPWASHDHQNKNAKALVDAGAALSLDQNSKNFAQELLDAIIYVKDNQKNFLAKLEKFLPEKNSSQNIVELICDISLLQPDAKNHEFSQ